MKKVIIMVSFLIFFNSKAVFAQGDVEKGKQKSMLCAACHMADGNSIIPMYPKIAGQYQSYIEKQLHDFKLAGATGGKKGRNDPIMIPMTMALSDEDISDLAAYFSANEISKGVAIDDALKEKAEKLYLAGDVEREITACAACHGKNGLGLDSAGFPSLAGQHAEYIKLSLNKFKKGERGNDANKIMQDNAKNLTQEDIELLSKYISSLNVN